MKIKIEYQYNPISFLPYEVFAKYKSKWICGSSSLGYEEAKLALLENINKIKNQEDAAIPELEEIEI